MEEMLNRMNIKYT